MMGTFQIKTYRCEWQIVSQPIGQYEEHTGPTSVLAVWPTREEAVKDRVNWAVEHEYIKKRWIPKDNYNGYVRVDIVYREVLYE